MGHEDIKTTLNIYGHLIKRSEQSRGGEGTRPAFDNRGSKYLL
jgi:hypothetical protein